MADGKAYCWVNIDGQLGEQQHFPDSAVPVAVNTAGVLAGRDHHRPSPTGQRSPFVCGGRWQGLLLGLQRLPGGSATTPPPNSKVPVAVNTAGVLAGRTVTAITAGYSHSCARGRGSGLCWGYNFDGRLGNNSTTGSPVPVAVNTAGVLAGEDGHQHRRRGIPLLVAVADGRASCWGNNFYGQPGQYHHQDGSAGAGGPTGGVLAWGVRQYRDHRRQDFTRAGAGGGTAAAHHR